MNWEDDLILLAFGAALIAIVIVMGGCTAATLQQQEAAQIAIRGNYVDGIGCTRLRTATGNAAVAAASDKSASQIQVKGRSK